MKQDRLWRHLAIALAGAVLVYAVVFAWLEHRRVRLGPWEVTFVHEPPDTPRLSIHHQKLGISDVTVILPINPAAAVTNVTLQFGPGRVVPFDVPLGECTYQDPLFLPGVVALELEGQQVQMFPRALKVNGVDHQWESGLTIEATAEAAGGQSTGME